MIISHAELSQRSVVDNAVRNSAEDLVQCAGVLDKSVVEKCWGRVRARSCTNSGEECCREVLEKGVVEKCWGRVL